MCVTHALSVPMLCPRNLLTLATPLGQTLHCKQHPFDEFNYAATIQQITCYYTCAHCWPNSYYSVQLVMHQKLLTVNYDVYVHLIAILPSMLTHEIYICIQRSSVCSPDKWLKWEWEMADQTQRHCNLAPGYLQSCS